MVKLIAACGIDCAACECREATLSNDNEKRQVIAVEWSDEYGAGLKPEHINCNGCMEPGIKFAPCNECAIRACVLSKALNNCAECPDFACEIISQFMAAVPPAKANLEALRG